MSAAGGLVLACAPALALAVDRLLGEPALRWLIAGVPLYLVGLTSLTAGYTRWDHRSPLEFVIALLFACLWLIRRLSAPRGGGAAIKVLGAAAVGPRERVVLVELGEQVLVLGVAPGSVTRLHDMKRSELPLPADAAGIAAPAGKAFAAWLKQATERRNAG